MTRFWPPAQSALCCTLYDIQCICFPHCGCRCKGCSCGPLTVRLTGPSEPLADPVGADLDPGDLYGSDGEG